MDVNNLSDKDILDLHFDLRARDFIHTSFPAKITRVVNSNVVDVEPLVTTLRRDGTVFPYTEIFDVRLHTYACKMGEVYISLPIQVGDLVWVMVSERDTALLMAGNGDKAQKSTTLRTHDLSDCFAIPAFFPDGKIQEYDKDNLVIGNADTKVVIKPSEINVEALSAAFNGEVQVEGKITSEEAVDAPTYFVGGVEGASGTFTSQDGKTVTVVKGLITLIV